MANQITDGRTSLTTADATTNFVDLAGTASGTLDTEIFYQGTGSVAYSTSNTRTGLLYNMGSAQNFSSNTFYFLVNCGIVGLLATKANGGLTIRFCGATITNWFEVRVAGSDNFPPSFSGGWTQFVVDIETARSAAVTNGWTNGTTPATSAIQYVGITTVTGGTMPRMVDNTWVDQIARLPDGSAGIIIEGSNGGTTPWTWNNVLTAASITNKWATCRAGDGGAITLSTPVQMGINDATNHEFEDTNKTLLWYNQEFLPNDFYALSGVFGSGTNSIVAGIKTGTGTAATGAQGWTIQSASGGARWNLDFDDANTDTIGLYGCSLINANDLQLDVAGVECINTLYIGCVSATVSNSLQQRISVINAATADGVAFMITDDLADINNSSFEFSDGHGIQLTGAAGNYTLSNVTFTGYGANTSNDAALYVSAGTGTFNINVDNGTTYRSGGATVNVVLSPVTTQVTVLNSSGTPIQNARVYLYAANGTGDLPYQDSISITSSGTTATVTHTAHGLTTNDYIRITGANEFAYNGTFQVTVTGANTYTYTMQASTTSPATGTIIATGVVINALSNASGVASDTRTWNSAQPVTGWVRKSTSAPYYQEAPLTGTISTSAGLSLTVQMISDE